MKLLFELFQPPLTTAFTVNMQELGTINNTGTDYIDDKKFKLRKKNLFKRSYKHMLLEPFRKDC
jgi:hypothetical protein